MSETLRSTRERAARWARARRGGWGLEARVAELEDEVQELRRLHRRLAELTDVVEELLVPIAQRDEEKVQRYLDSHGTPL